MQQFTYVIQDSLGIHARPAGLLVKTVKNYSNTTVTISRGNRSAEADQLLKLLSLGIKQGDEITVTVQGPEEKKATASLEQFFREYL